jgi:PAS domain S-box-containing protein
VSQPRSTAELVALICASHQRLLGTRLVDPALAPEAAAHWLYEDAPFCVLAHEAAADPRFIYANRAAQRCFEYAHDELVGLPSRLSAEAPDRAERQALLDAVAAKGFATGYRGLRIAKSGRRFWIEDVTVWNLIDAKGINHGQAATYRRITPFES